MSKVSLTSYMGDNSLKTSNHTASKTLLAKSPREVKLNNARSPYKPGSNLIRNVSNSPFETIQKPSYALTNIKSPTEKSYLVGSLGDNVDAKENCSFEAKLLPSTQRDVKKTIISFNTNKSIADIIPANMAKSGTTSQLITQRNKSPTCENYEALTSRTSRKPEIQIQKAFVPLMKESKSSSLLEPSKKASLPTSLKLTLEKICRKEGSSTHRIVLGSPTSEASKLGEIVSGQQKKVARAKNEEVDRSTSDVNAKHKLKMLVGLTKAPISQRKKSSKNVNSVNGTPRQDYSAVYSIDEDSEMMKRYNKLVGLLKEKNQEIKKLSENNSHLQNTLDFMEEELKGLRKEKGGPGCKNEIPGDICDSIQLDDSRAQSYRQTGRSPALSPTMMQSVYLYQKSAIDLSSSEIKPSKPMASPLGVAYQKNVKSISDRMGKSWIINMDDRTRDSRKRSSHADSSLDHTEGVEKNSWYAKPEQIVQGHREKLSYLKEIDEEFEEQRNRNVKMSELPENLTRNADNQRKKIRKLKLEKRERETASFRDEVILRNSSVDAEGGQSGQVSRRNGGLNNTMAPFTPGLTNREELGNFDIGEALNGLKDRIKNLLVKKDGGSAKNDALYQNLRAHFQKGN